MTESARLQNFILVFDHRTGRAQPVEQFGADPKKALARYEELESRYRDDAEMDIVLVASDSLETVKVTHANYFDGTAATAKLDGLIGEYLAGVGATA